MTGPFADTELVNAQEVADMLGLKHRNAVSTYQRRFGDMPRPVVDPGPGRPKLWSRPDVENWMIDTGRAVRPEKWHGEAEYQNILDGLSGHLDRDLFEDCVVDILNPQIPVVPIKGGDDGGMDGAVFDGEGLPYPLVVTTSQDGIGNLNRNLRRYIEVGGRRRRVVFVTSQRLTPQKRRNIEGKASTLGFVLVQTFDQRGVANLLYKNPRWCKRLLGLTGEPQPFSRYPPISRTLHHTKLEGRSKEVSFLLCGKGDQLLVGPPGSGKTALLSQLVEKAGAWFLHPSDRASINNGVRTLTSTTVLVDDAHTHLEELQLLVRLRNELDLPYRIVASSWPGKTDAVTDILDLASSDIADVPQLTRNQIVEVVKQVGVEGSADLVREIVEQARGLPGLAVTLARACLRGEIREVGSGDAIGREVRRVLDIQGLNHATRILAALSLGGQVGMSLEDAAECLGLSFAQTQREMAELATAGVLGLAEDQAGMLGQTSEKRWVVYPLALRHALVRDVFFGNGPTLSPRRFLERVTTVTAGDDVPQFMEPLPENLRENAGHREVARTLIGAKTAGRRVSRQLLIEHLRASESDRAWAEWAVLGANESRHALREQATALEAHPRPFLHWIPNEAIAGLLDAAAGGKRDPVHILGEPPLQVVTKWIKEKWQPEEAYRRRRVGTEATIRWGKAHPASDLPGRILSAVLSPGFEYTTLDPGAGDTLTIHSGILQESTLQEIVSLWNDHILPFLKSRPRATLRPVIRAVASWKNLSYGTPALPSLEEAKATQTLAKPMIADLLDLASDHLGLQLQVAELAKEVGMNPKAPDSQYALMYGPLDGADVEELEAAETEREVTARSLGATHAGSSPATVASRLASLETAASEAGHGWPRYTPLYAEALAQHSSTDPLEWARQFAASDLQPDLVQPFLAKASRNGRLEIWEAVHNLMDQPKYEWLAIRTVLTGCDVPPHLRNEAITRIAPHTTQLVWTLRRDDLDRSTIRHLLQHENDMVASTVAIGMWSRDHKPIADPEIETLWSRAILRTREDQGDDYQLGRVLAADQHLAVEWLSKQFSTSLPFSVIEKSPTAVAIDSLDEQSRIDLIRRLQPKWPSPQVTARVVGNSLAVYQALLEEEDLKDLHLDPLAGRLDQKGMGLDAAWASRVEMALESGYLPEEIASAVFPGSYVWSGSESQMWESWIAAFQAVPSNVAGMRTIRDVAIETARQRRANALAREHKRQVYGNNYAG